APVETPPAPQDVPTIYSAQLPAGPFAHTPHWSEDFDNSTGAMPSYWNLLVNHDPANSSTRVANDHAAILSNDRATGVPVWGIVDDVLPATHLLAQSDWGDYFSRRREKMATVAPFGEQVFHYPRVDWRPNRGNIRYAWKAVQTAD